MVYDNESNPSHSYGVSLAIWQLILVVVVSLTSICTEYHFADDQLFVELQTGKSEYSYLILNRKLMISF